MVTAATLRKLALALSDASEVPHMDRAAFRTPRRIFVTLAPDAQTANLMFGAEEQELFCRSLPAAFAPVDGGWGKMGATTVVLSAITHSQLRDALQAAHARAVAPKKRVRGVTAQLPGPQPKVRAKPKATVKKPTSKRAPS